MEYLLEKCRAESIADVGIAKCINQSHSIEKRVECALDKFASLKGNWQHQSAKNVQIGE